MRTSGSGRSLGNPRCGSGWSLGQPEGDCSLARRPGRRETLKYLHPPPAGKLSVSGSLPPTPQEPPQLDARVFLAALPPCTKLGTPERWRFEALLRMCQDPPLASTHLPSMAQAAAESPPPALSTLSSLWVWGPSSRNPQLRQRAGCHRRTPEFGCGVGGLFWVLPQPLRSPTHQAPFCYQNCCSRLASGGCLCLSCRHGMGGIYLFIP